MPELNTDRIERPFPGGSELSAARTKEVVDSLLEALRNEEPDRFAEAINWLFYTCAWRKAFLAIRRQANPSDSFRTDMRKLWARRAGMIRNGVGDDLLVADCMRKLLTPYDGGDMVLYRGETLTNRCRRTYGMCWSSEEWVARHHARNAKRTYPRGAVVLKAYALKEAIIANIHEVSKFPREAEYVVDRRQLTASMIEVVDQYPQETTGGEGLISDRPPATDPRPPHSHIFFPHIDNGAGNHGI